MAAPSGSGQAQSSRIHGHSWLRMSLLLAMGLLLGGLIAAGSATAQEHSVPWLLVCIVVALLLIVIVWIHIRIFHYNPTRKQFDSDHQVVSINYASLRDDTGPLSSSLSDSQLRNFVEILKEPKSVRGRIVEEIRPLKRALRQHVSANITLMNQDPGSLALDDKQTQEKRTEPRGLDHVLYPIMMPPKGALQDDLDVRINGDQPVATLSYNEYLLLVAKALSSLLSPAKAKLNTKDDRDELDRLEDLAFKYISLRGLVEDITGLTSCIEGLKEMSARLAANKNEIEAQFVSLVISLVEQLHSNYAIVGLLPREREGLNRAIVKYERYLIPSLNLARPSSFIAYMRDRLRMLLGTRPISLELPLSNAALASSYHLMVFGPDGMHVGWQQLSGNHERMFSTSSNEAKTIASPYKRFRKRLGQGYLHLYMRSITPEIADELRLSVRFYETPPGSMAPAMVASTACFALVYIAGAVISSTNRTFVSDFPALVLAFPAVAAALIGFDRAPNRLIDGTLASRLSSFIVIATSVLASGLYMAQTADKMKAEWGFHLFFMDMIWWQVLAAVAFVNFVFATYVWVTRTFGFYWLAARKTVDSEAMEGV